MSVEDQISAWNAGNRGGISFGTSSAEIQAFDAGAQARAQSGGGAAAGGGGGVLLIPFLLLLPVVFVVGTCLYPLPGVLALLAMTLAGELLGDSINTLVMLVVVIVAGAAAFMGGLFVERRLERFAGYRWIRHALRVILAGFVANVIVFAFSGAGEFSPQTGFLDRLSVTHVVLVVAAMVGAYFVSRRMDAKFGSAASFFTRFRLRRQPA